VACGVGLLLDVVVVDPRAGKSSMVNSAGLLTAAAAAAVDESNEDDCAAAALENDSPPVMLLLLKSIQVSFASFFVFKVDAVVVVVGKNKIPFEMVVFAEISTCTCNY
jgi:hypothetical protein